MSILFISWDGPFVNYMEGLFLPIFAGLKKKGYDVHILQFSWSPPEKIAATARLCADNGIPYQHVVVATWPHPSIGKFTTVTFGHRHILQYLVKNNIDVVMPRTMMPSKMVLSLLKARPFIKIVFEADGLPIEERVDFAGLKRGSLRYNQLKRVEKRMVLRADVVLTRSTRAIAFLQNQYPEASRSKFFKVINGRDETLFAKSSDTEIQALRAELNIPSHAFVSVYCGSLGPQYGVDEMIWLHQQVLTTNPDAYWLILSGDPQYMSRFPDLKNIIIRKVAANEVPRYLSIAQLGFAIRKPTLSMQGVSPIKLGEYLLLGIPVIASAGIGDTEEIIQNKPFCFLLPDHSPKSLAAALKWMLTYNQKNNDGARQTGITHFGLQRAIESYSRALDQLKSQD